MAVEDRRRLKEALEAVGEVHRLKKRSVEGAVGQAAGQKRRLEAGEEALEVDRRLLQAEEARAGWMKVAKVEARVDRPSF